MSDRLTIIVETIRSGQPRPYADHEFESIITYDRAFVEAIPRAHSKALVESWEEAGKGDWASGRLVSIEPLDAKPGVTGLIATTWRVKIRRAYTG